jgi:Ni/Co efflux regulator RcnB
MRKLYLSLLLAGVAATPALAGPKDDDRNHPQQVREERHQAREERQQARQERPQFNGGQRFGGGTNGGQPQFVRQERVQQQNPNVVQQNNGGEARNWRGRPEWNAAQQNAADGARNWRGRQPYGGQVQTQYAPNYSGYRNRTHVVGVDNNRRVRQVTWNRNWRNDNRYDWRNYRDRHRSTFHLGIYLDPFGYGYQPFGIGYRLTPAYFGQRYWIDPGMYQLPYPPPGTQWVRYWNDAVLVDMYSGQVVDVIRDFFW